MRITSASHAKGPWIVGGLLVAATALAITLATVVVPGLATVDGSCTIDDSGRGRCHYVNTSSLFRGSACFTVAIVSGSRGRNLGDLDSTSVCSGPIGAGEVTDTWFHLPGVAKCQGPTWRRECDVRVRRRD